MYRVLRLGAMVCLFLSAARADLFLITGSYSNGWNYTSASRLVRVTTDGKVSSAATLVSSTDGFIWAGVSYDSNVAAVLVPGKRPMIRFISLTTGGITKNCELPQHDGLSYWYSADVPEVGAVVLMRNPPWPPLKGVDEYLDQIRAKEDVPCRDSFKKAPRGNLRYATPLGIAGVGDFVMNDGFDAYAYASGRIVKTFAGNKEIDLDIQLPSGVVTKEGRQTYLATRNREIIVISLLRDEKRSARFFVLNRSGGRWREIPETLSAGVMRGFGPYIAITEAHTKRAVAAQLKLHPGNLEINKAVMTEELSAGQMDWRRESGPDGPSLVESFANSTDVFPGRLHVFDSRTGLAFTLKTNQGDSEILLIENGTVYYRVSDRRYSIPISDKGFGRARLLATDRLIGDAHSAFATR